MSTAEERGKTPFCMFKSVCHQLVLQVVCAGKYNDSIADEQKESYSKHTVISYTLVWLENTHGTCELPIQIICFDIFVPEWLVDPTQILN